MKHLVGSRAPQPGYTRRMTPAYIVMSVLRMFAWTQEARPAGPGLLLTSASTGSNVGLVSIRGFARVDWGQ